MTDTTTQPTLEQMEQEYNAVIKELEYFNVIFQQALKGFMQNKSAPGVYITARVHLAYIDILLELVEERILLPEIKVIALEIKDTLDKILLELQKSNPNVKIHH